MVKTDAEYRQMLERLKALTEQIRQERAACEAKGCTPKELLRRLEPLETSHTQLKSEVAAYRKLQAGRFDELMNFHGIGNLLIALRVYGGLSQRDLAAKLGVHESQVSRDERNEYHGITVERANRILDALDAELRTTVAKMQRTLTIRSKSGWADKLIWPSVAEDDQHS